MPVTYFTNICVLLYIYQVRVGAWDGVIKLDNVELRGRNTKGTDASNETPRNDDANNLFSSPSSIHSPSSQSSSSTHPESARTTSGFEDFSPITFVAGKIGELQIRIPYMSFWRRSCHLKMRKVRLRLGPMREDDVRLTNCI